MALLHVKRILFLMIVLPGPLQVTRMSLSLDAYILIYRNFPKLTILFIVIMPLTFQIRDECLFPFLCNRATSMKF